MTPLEERYEGLFVCCDDLPEGQAVSVEIESIAMPGTEQDSRKKVIDKAIVTFKGATKRFILNKTNYRVLKGMFGKDHNGWIGQTIQLQRRYITFRGEPAMGIRIIPPKGTILPLSVVSQMGTREPPAE